MKDLATLRCDLIGVAILAIGLPNAVPAQESHFSHEVGAGTIAYHYVGRVNLNFLNNTGVVYGYITDLAGIATASSLFRGTPSESTALMTFRADISFQPLPGNGALGNGQFAVSPALVSPGTYQIYFTQSPAHDWSDPNTFSNGQIIATLARGLEQFSVLGTTLQNVGSAVLKSSVPFPVNGQNTDLSSLIPNGSTNITTAPVIALPGSMATAPVFAFSGYALAIGR